MRSESAETKLGKAISDLLKEAMCKLMRYISQPSLHLEVASSRH